MTPIITTWVNPEDSGYPSIRGRVELYNITFAKFGASCTHGLRANFSDYAIAANALAADANHPVYTRNVEMFEVEKENVAHIPPPLPELISQVL
jgi:hypothetical protein